MIGKFKEVGLVQLTREQKKQRQAIEQGTQNMLKRSRELESFATEIVRGINSAAEWSQNLELIQNLTQFVQTNWVHADPYQRRAFLPAIIDILAALRAHYGADINALAQHVPVDQLGAVMTIYGAMTIVRAVIINDNTIPNFEAEIEKRTQTMLVKREEVEVKLLDNALPKNARNQEDVREVAEELANIESQNIRFEHQVANILTRINGSGFTTEALTQVNEDALTAHAQITRLRNEINDLQRQNIEGEAGGRDDRDRQIAALRIEIQTLQRNQLETQRARFHDLVIDLKLLWACLNIENLPRYYPGKQMTAEEKKLAFMQIVAEVRPAMAALIQRLHVIAGIYDEAAKNAEGIPSLAASTHDYVVATTMLEAWLAGDKGSSTSTLEDVETKAQRDERQAKAQIAEREKAKADAEAARQKAETEKEEAKKKKVALNMNANPVEQPADRKLVKDLIARLKNYNIQEFRTLIKRGDYAEATEYLNQVAAIYNELQEVTVNGWANVRNLRAEILAALGTVGNVTDSAEGTTAGLLSMMRGAMLGHNEFEIRAMLDRIDQLNGTEIPALREAILATPEIVITAEDVERDFQIRERNRMEKGERPFASRFNKVYQYNRYLSELSTSGKYSPEAVSRFNRKQYQELFSTIHGMRDIVNAGEENWENVAAFVVPSLRLFVIMQRELNELNPDVPRRPKTEEEVKQMTEKEKEEEKFRKFLELSTASQFNEEYHSVMHELALIIEEINKQIQAEKTRKETVTQKKQAEIHEKANPFYKKFEPLMRKLEGELFTSYFVDSAKLTEVESALDEISAALINWNVIPQEERERLTAALFALLDNRRNWDTRFYEPVDGAEHEIVGRVRAVRQHINSILSEMENLANPAADPMAGRFEELEQVLTISRDEPGSVTAERLEAVMSMMNQLRLMLTDGTWRHVREPGGVTMRLLIYYRILLRLFDDLPDELEAQARDVLKTVFYLYSDLTAATDGEVTQANVLNRTQKVQTTPPPPPPPPADEPPAGPVVEIKPDAEVVDLLHNVNNFQIYNLDNLDKLSPTELGQAIEALEASIAHYLKDHTAENADDVALRRASVVLAAIYNHLANVPEGILRTNLTSRYLELRPQLGQLTSDHTQVEIERNRYRVRGFDEATFPAITDPTFAARATQLLEDALAVLSLEEYAVDAEDIELQLARVDQVLAAMVRMLHAADVGNIRIEGYARLIRAWQAVMQARNGLAGHTAFVPEFPVTREDKDAIARASEAQRLRQEAEQALEAEYAGYERRVDELLAMNDVNVAAQAVGFLSRIVNNAGPNSGWYNLTPERRQQFIKKLQQLQTAMLAWNAIQGIDQSLVQAAMRLLEVALRDQYRDESFWGQQSLERLKTATASFDVDTSSASGSAAAEPAPAEAEPEEIDAEADAETDLPEEPEEEPQAVAESGDQSEMIMPNILNYLRNSIVQGLDPAQTGELLRLHQANRARLNRMVTALGALNINNVVVNTAANVAQVEQNRDQYVRAVRASRVMFENQRSGLKPEEYANRLVNEVTHTLETDRQNPWNGDHEANRLAVARMLFEMLTKILSTAK